MWIANQAQCQEIDRRATADFGISSAELMERAGEAVFAEVQRLNPEKPWLGVVCGRGNNGGDGLVVARYARAAFRVRCLVTSPEFEINDNCRHQLLLARDAGIEPIFSDHPDFRSALAELLQQSVIVDAILGTGARGSVVGVERDAIEAINNSDATVISVDVPSGIETNTGRSLGANVRADKTVTFGLPKPCFFQGDGLESSGQLAVADIGFPPELLVNPTEACITDVADARILFPLRSQNSHKGSNGHLLIVAGSKNMPGAAVLATLAALRSGVGLVTIASIESVCTAVGQHCPEALLLPIPESHGVIASLASKVLLDEQSKFSSAVFGPGLTKSDSVREFLEQLWPAWNLSTVIDADALNLVASGIKLPAGPCVLTPHPGEMARLLQCSSAEIQANRFESVRQASEKYNQTVVLKGAYTLIASPGEPTKVNPTGNPGMATGGMGDVLSGIIGTLLAQGLTLHEAATLGNFWHGFSGDLCKSEIGEIGYTASDLASYLPMARAKIIAS